MYQAVKIAGDVVIVGGGIAGSVLALVLTRGGIPVIVLERQREYADRVRGEYVHPWGVAEAQRLEIIDILLGAGGVLTTRGIGYDESLPAEVAEARARNLASILSGVPGGLGLSHPAACLALSRAAEASGARIWRGAGDVRVTAGARPAVVFEAAGERHEAQCRLIVGADGRGSTVRRQAGLALSAAAPTHLFSGMLVGGIPDWPPGTIATASAGDLQCQIFPQDGGRARLYTSTSPDHRRRYDGADGRARFLDDFRRTRCMPWADMLGAGTPQGPCATFGGEDTWVDVPVANGVVLIGDAAGYNDPLIGQGLSLAIRDARSLSEILLAGNDWSAGSLRPYAEERRARGQRVRFTATLMAAIYAAFTPDGAARRARFLARLPETDFRGRNLLACLGLGPERSPDWAYSAEFRSEVLAPGR